MYNSLALARNRRKRRCYDCNFNTVGRIILGTLSDKIGRMKIVSATFIIIGLSVFTLSFIPLNYGIYFACVASVAFCFGGNITIFPAIVGDFFGLKTIVQITGLSTKVSDLVRLQDHLLSDTRGFQPTFIIIGVLSVISFIISILIRPPNVEKKKELKHLHRKVA